MYHSERVCLLSAPTSEEGKWHGVIGRWPRVRCKNLNLDRVTDSETYDDF